MREFSKVLYSLVFVTILVIAGCQQSEPEVEELVFRPAIEDFAAIPDFLADSIAAVGGIDAWMDVNEIDFDCIVTFYKPDGTYYLTGHSYRVYTWRPSVQITTDEPKGCIELPLPAKLSQSDFSEMIIAITTAPARFLDTSYRFSKADKPVKIEGLWYSPIERSWVPPVLPTDTAESVELIAPVKPDWSKVVFYQNNDKSAVDMIWFADVDRDKFLAVRGYDYVEIEKNGVLIPTKIEVFRTDGAGNLLNRLIKLDLQ